MDYERILALAGRLDEEDYDHEAASAEVEREQQLEAAIRQAVAKAGLELIHANNAVYILGKDAEILLDISSYEGVPLNKLVNLASSGIGVDFHVSTGHEYALTVKFTLVS